MNGKSKLSYHYQLRKGPLTAHFQIKLNDNSPSNGSMGVNQLSQTHRINLWKIK